MSGDLGGDGVGGRLSFTVLVIPASLGLPCHLEQISDLDQMQAIVGGYIEAVRVDWGRLTNPLLPEGVHVARQAILYVNEEFRYQDVPYNSRASWLYPWDEGIYGDAFLCGPATFDGYDTDVPIEAVQFFLS